MSRAKKTSSDKAFVNRLKDISESLGSYAALAKRAGLAASTFQNYLDGGEPQRPALIALAAAGGVSLHWLATGQGPKSPTLLPAGYVEIPRFDLRHNIYALMQRPPADSTILRADLVESVESIGAPLASLNSALVADGWPPQIADGDLVIFSESPSRLSGHDQGGFDRLIQVAEGQLYLLAQGAKAVVRRVNRKTIKGKTATAILLTDSAGNQHTIETGSSEFQILGRIVWRGGIVRN